MSFYCCFFHPEHKDIQETLEDRCAVCGRKYRYPLDKYPDRIINQENKKEYLIKEPLDRGFYGATYLCETSARFSSKKTLLKVIPEKVYSYFKKDFYSECERHARVSEETNHLVGIEDAFSANIDFGGNTISCYIAELQYIE